MKLNSKKPFAKIYGPGRARYEQDGIMFDAQLDAILTPEQEAEIAAKEEAEKKPASTRGKKADAAKKADADIDDQLAAQTGQL